MTEINFTEARCLNDQGGYWLCLKVDIPAIAQRFVLGMQKRLYTAALKIHRERRSLDANAYAWALIGKIADAIRSDKDSVYLMMLKSYGQGGVVSVEQRYSADFKRTWRYHESLGTSELNGKTFEHFRFWVGSHLYDTREMSILIDGIVSECKALDIETATPEEIERMKARWADER